jgi:AAA family ATPase
LRLTVQSIEPQPDENCALYFDPVRTQITTPGYSPTPKPAQESAQEPAKSSSELLELKSEGIGGLSDHIATINKSLFFLTHAALTLPDPHLLGPTTFLLHGPEGTGKTMLLDRLADNPWQEVYRVNPETHAKGQARAIAETFEEARENQPSLILLDDLDKFLEKAETLVGKLRSELAKLEGSRVVVAAAARSVYDIDSSLRTTSAFKAELEIFPPNLKQREDIFRGILGPARATSGVDFTAIAERSHGFVGRDIHKLCGLARNHKVQQVYDSLDSEKKSSIGEALGETDFVSQEDFDAVIDQVQPTVLKDSILEVPKVKWTEIAGLDHVRALLEAITIRPFKVSCSIQPSHSILTAHSTLTLIPNLVGPRIAKAFCCTVLQVAQRL